MKKERKEYILKQAVDSYCRDDQGSLNGLFYEYIKELAEAVPEEKIEVPYSPLIKYIGEKIRFLESKTKMVAVLQFTDHPEGMAMILRMYIAKYDKEYTFPDVILMLELDGMDSVLKEKARIDVLFDEIHRALNKIQIISGDKAKSAGIIQ